MLEVNLQEWEEYDARLLDDTPFVRGAPSAQRTGRESLQTYGESEGSFESPFHLGNTGEAAAEMEGLASELGAGISGENQWETRTESPGSAGFQKSLSAEPDGKTWLAESFEADPYASIRSALSPEYENLSADEITVVLGRMPATMVLHQLLNSPATQQATLASLVGKSARRSVRVNGADISVPAYLRMMSRLCGEVAEQSETSAKAPVAKPKKPAPFPPGPRGVNKYPHDESRMDFVAFYQLALQAVAAKPKLSAQQKAELAEKIADACMNSKEPHAARTRCAEAAAPDPASKDTLNMVLVQPHFWGQAFKSALQTTAADDRYTSPEQAVKEAVDIADQALLAAGQLDENLWNLFMKCKKP